MEIDIPVERVRTGKPDVIAFKVPEPAREPLRELFKTGDFFRLKLSRPYRRRSTGYKSQNHRINGFIQQICVKTGMPFQGLKEFFKAEAIGEGYPFVTLPSGEVIGDSEANISVEEASILIGVIERYAAEWGVELVE